MERGGGDNIGLRGQNHEMTEGEHTSTQEVGNLKDQDAKKKHVWPRDKSCLGAITRLEKGNKKGSGGPNGKGNIHKNKKRKTLNRDAM